MYIKTPNNNILNTFQERLTYCGYYSILIEVHYTYLILFCTSVHMFLFPFIIFILS